MKKMLIGFFAVLLAAATAFATQAPTTTRVDDPVLYWFDGATFMGTGTISQKEIICNGNTDDVCLDGFEEAPNQQRPTGDPYHTLYREE